MDVLSVRWLTNQTIEKEIEIFGNITKKSDIGSAYFRGSASQCDYLLFFYLLDELDTHTARKKVLYYTLPLTPFLLGESGLRRWGCLEMGRYE